MKFVVSQFLVFWNFRVRLVRRHHGENHSWARGRQAWSSVLKSPHHGILSNSQLSELPEFYVIQITRNS